MCRGIMTAFVAEEMLAVELADTRPRAAVGGSMIVMQSTGRDPGMDNPQDLVWRESVPDSRQDPCESSPIRWPTSTRT